VEVTIMSSDMYAELEAARNARVPYLDPGDLGSYQGRRERVVPSTDVATSYLTQDYVRVRRGVRVHVRPLAESAAPGGLDRPDTVWLLTAWNPDGRASTLAEQQESNAQLRQRVLRAGGQIVGVGVTASPDRSWVEDHIRVVGLGADVAIRIGVQSGQPAVPALLCDMVVVMPTGRMPTLRQSTMVAVTRYQIARTCPMRLDDTLGARCTMRGGPYGSAAISAAAVWGSHRRLLLRRLGCDACADGSQPTSGPWGRAVGAESFGDMVLPSRFGGWAWR
jgi:hypothetical protein